MPEFQDLCIPFTKNPSELSKLLNECIRLGYKSVAINKIYDSRVKNNKKNTRPDQVPEPEKLDCLKEFQSKLTILSRLTVILSDTDVLHRMVRFYKIVLLIVSIAIHDYLIFFRTIH